MTYLHSLKKHFLLLLFFLVIIFCCYPGLFIHFSSAVIRGDMGDLKNILSIISYSIHAPIGEIYHLPVFYPETFMLAKTHPLFGISLFFKLFDSMGFSLTQSVNLYIIFSLTAGAWGTYLLAKEFLQEKWFWLALVFSSVYILHPMNHLHFVWLNFLSRFYMPFIVLFLIRYFKSGKKGFAVGVAILSFMQFLACMYYGVILGVLLIPMAILARLVLERVRFSRLWFLGAVLSVAFVAIVFIYFPYITQNTGSLKHFDGKLVQVEELFSVSKTVGLFLGSPGSTGQYLFPGFLLGMGVLLFWPSFLVKGRGVFTFILAAFLVSLCLMVYVNRNGANLLFLVFVLLLVYLTVKGWKEMKGWERLVVLLTMFLSFFLFQFTFPAFLKLLAPYRLFYGLLPVGGLTVIKRAFLFLLPFYVVLASVGTARMIPVHWRDRSKSRLLLFGACILAVLMLENIRNPLLYLRGPVADSSGGTGLMVPLTEEADVYKHLPANAGKVVLEIPYYFRRRLKSTDYMLNQRFHGNYLMNGKVSILPESYFRDLSDIIGKFQMDFPTKQAILRLKERYRTDYVIFHWERLKEYQSIRRSAVPKELILERIAGLESDGDVGVVFQDDCHLLLELVSRKDDTLVD